MYRHHGKLLSWAAVFCLCRVTESVATSLEGCKLASFTRVSTAVQQAVEGALTRILTPKRSIDVLREVKAAQVTGVVVLLCC